jgi:hypothetical protein
MLFALNYERLLCIDKNNIPSRVALSSFYIDGLKLRIYCFKKKGV